MNGAEAEVNRGDWLPLGNGFRHRWCCFGLPWEVAGFHKKP